MAGFCAISFLLGLTCLLHKQNAKPRSTRLKEAKSAVESSATTGTVSIAGVPTGNWQATAGQNNYPSINAKGDRLWIPIDYWTGSESDAGVFSPCLETPYDDHGNPLELCLEATITRNLVKTDILQIPLQGSIPSNIETTPVWTIANRGIYWLASSEDDKEFAGGYLTMSSVAYLNTTTQPYAPFNCTNEYRASFADTRTFGTLIGNAVASGAPSDAFSCWVDGGSSISPNVMVGGGLQAQSPRVTGVPPRLSVTRGMTSSRKASRNRSRPAIGRSRMALPFSRAYDFPGGLWSLDSHGKLVRNRNPADALPKFPVAKTGKGKVTRSLNFRRSSGGWALFSPNSSP